MPAEITPEREETGREENRVCMKAVDAAASVGSETVGAPCAIPIVF